MTKSVNTNLILARFKSNQGLSNQDIKNIFQLSEYDSQQWNRHPNLIPDYANAAALALNTIMERWKKEKGVFNDVDHQHLMKNAENLKKEYKALGSAYEKLQLDNTHLKNDNAALRSLLSGLQSRKGKSKILGQSGTIISFDEMAKGEHALKSIGDHFNSDGNY